MDDSLELKDLGVSSFTGRNLEKGALGVFIDACERGLVRKGSALIVEAMDRLSRQRPRRTVSLLTRLLDDFGIEVHLTSIGKVFRPDATAQEEGMDLMLAVGMACAAHESSANKSFQLQAAWAKIRREAAEGKRVMRPADIPWWLVLKDGKIVAPTERATILRRIFRLTAEGLSSLQIARALNAEHVDTFRKQKIWTSARIRGVVADCRPEGHIRATLKTRQAGRDYTIENYYPRVIDKELAAAARATLVRNTRGSRGRGPSTGARPSNLFRGLLRFRRKWLRHGTHQNGLPDSKTGVKGFNGYYECVDELGGRNGGRMLYCISAKQLEPIVASALLELTPKDLEPERDNPAQQRLIALRGELACLKEKEKNLLAAVESGSVAVARRLPEIEALVRKKEAEVAQTEVLASRPISFDTTDLKPLVQNLQDPKARELAAAAIRRLVTRIDIGEDYGDLFVTDNVRTAFIRALTKKRSGAFPDPTPLRGRKPVWLLINFASGALRIIARPAAGASTLRAMKSKDADQILSFRIEAEDVIPEFL